LQASLDHHPYCFVVEFWVAEHINTAADTTDPPIVDKVAVKQTVRRYVAARQKREAVRYAEHELLKMLPEDFDVTYAIACGLAGIDERWGEGYVDKFLDEATVPEAEQAIKERGYCLF